ncbi:isoleucine--tRNA ligase [Entomospira culicis]|uniref:Isoleucine--tRNA ligase n=1 Tax=Entomospira culicis TaxID=2719989 RepID=A0A968GIW3_9SPIO|nr:isoleucine--tRNA ligase [Entomospira culicis]NIZ19600.1 isoleucine--tRNA ligase [Entomospira culicis]NIZ69495.1 isoleucine--tRNA ligase [Entomospira culicis]WDI36610.1 isoleucine--tRNA ligase [Entomospira culicis]WDI38238.1 isoleucine--tRNA ligase [Entomospira culicis]
MYKPVDPKTNFPKLEESILAFWQAEQIFARSLEQTKTGKPFIQYDGPPFATGLPHYGHLIQSALKDTFPRYKTMQGFHVERRFGWDCHGLPIEYEMEKELGVSGKSQIEAYGVPQFNQACSSIVMRYSSQWQEYINRLGRWVDFENDYKTMSPQFMESVWWVFKELYHKDLVKEGSYILPYCPRCSTPLSNHELNLGGYKEVSDMTGTVRFALVDEEQTFFYAWTTTPWTLPSNLALAVGPELTYVKIRILASGEQVYLAQARLESYFKEPQAYQILGTYQGKELMGKRYQPLFPYFADLATRGAFQVYPADYVGEGDGTGIVHTANGFGEDDYLTLKHTGLPTICPVDDEGRYTAEIADYVGRYVKDCDKDILRQLKGEGKLVKQEPYLHNYPHCWRCESPLIYRAIGSWFIDVPKIIPRMLAANEQITWIPGHIKAGRFGRWLENARDWAISRNRYWGNPIPVWRCDSCKAIEVIGSRDELEQKSGARPDDLHKHIIDEVTWSCGCGGIMHRIPEVFDCWFESGAMPLAQHHYPFGEKQELDALMPADFIVEGIDQTRGWFYTLTVLAVALFDRPAFKMCLTTGLVLASDGQKMSKSKKNYTDPLEIINTYGADATRIYLQSSPLSQGADLRFVDDGVRDVLKGLMLPIWNAYSFFVTYANIDKMEVGDLPKTLHHELDRWIVSRTHRLIGAVESAMDVGDIHQAIKELEHYVDVLNNWYIRRSRRRFWKSDSDLDKEQAYASLYHALYHLSLVMAPLIPFMSEAIYQNLKRPNDPMSVHLATWPKVINSYLNKELEDQMALILQSVRLAHALRSSANIKNRIPLAKLYVVSRNADERATFIKMSEVLQEEVNVKSVVVESAEERLVDYTMKANFKILGKVLGKDMKVGASAIEALPTRAILSLLAGERLTIEFSGVQMNHLEIGLEDVLITRHAKADVQTISEGHLTVALDTTLTPELLREGMMRDLIRAIQNLRKESDFAVSDRITFTLVVENAEIEAEFALILSEFGAFIKREVLATNHSLSVGVSDSASDIVVGTFSAKLVVKRV